MRPVDPAEISALLDDELSPERAEQVRRAIAEDGELRRVFEELSAVHADLTHCAAAPTFQPQLTPAKGASSPTIAIIGLGLALLTLRLMVKLVPLGVGVAIQATALVIVLLWVFGCLLRSSNDERWRIAEAGASNMA